MIPNARFVELLEDIEPKQTTMEDSQAAHSKLRHFLRNHRTFGPRVVDDFLAGSYKRQTAIRPQIVEGKLLRPDIDIIVVCDFTSRDRPQRVLDALSFALSERYEIDRINKRSVRVASGQAEMDVVPVISAGDAYRIPDRVLKDWLLTDPPAHNRWSQKMNEAFEGRFKPLVKLFKWWRRVRLAEPRPKGFILEVLVALYAPTKEQHLGRAFARLLENLDQEWGRQARDEYKPRIYDPVVTYNDILHRVSLRQWQAFLRCARWDAARAHLALETSDLDRATRLWQKLFGKRFPESTRHSAS